MYNMYGSIASSALGLIGSVINTHQVNEANKQMVRETNEANRQMVEMQNKAAKEEAELAYKRSSAPNQVNLMRAAGMSRAGAINALNGGGSYTPAPVNTSQDSAATMQTTDLSALANIGQAFENQANRKLQEKLQAQQLKHAEKEAEKQREHEIMMKDIDSINTTQAQYLDYEKHKERLGFDYANARQNWRIIDKQVEYISKQTKSLDLGLSAQKLDIERKRLENENYPTLARLMNEKAMREIERLILDYNQAVDNHTLDKEMKNLSIRFEKLTQDSRINVENARNELETYTKVNTLAVDDAAGGFFGALDYLLTKFKGFF